MALTDVVLGLVCVAPAHGYALHAQLVRVLGRDARLERQHVYAALRALARDGLVVARDERAPRTRRRRIYAATDAGRAATRAWLARPLGDTRTILQRPLLVKAAALELLDVAPERRALLAESARLDRIDVTSAMPAGAATSDLAHLARLLRARERRHAAVERWLVDRLAERQVRATGHPARGATTRPRASTSR